jgi:hypothetical protein
VDLIVERCAGLDVAKDEVVACVRSPGTNGRRRQEIRRTLCGGLIQHNAAWHPPPGPMALGGVDHGN